MSTTGTPSERVLQAQFRVTKRGLDKALNEIAASIKTRKESAIPGIKSDLNEVSVQLKALHNTCSELVDHIHPEEKSDDQIKQEEDALMADYDRLFDRYREQKRDFLALEYSVLKAKANDPNSPERRSLGMNSTMANIETNTVKLPRVELRKFSGNRREFHDWAGLFENIIAKDERFDTLQKLYYLKTLLEGDAAKIVANVPFEASAFDPAWKAVKEFYGNKRSLIAQHFGEILDLPPIKNEDDIRYTLCTVTAAMRGLDVHGVNSKAMAPFITYVIVRKFSVTIRREWEKAVPDTTNYPEFSALEQFLKNIAFAFEGAKFTEREQGNAKSSTQPKRTVMAAANATPSSAEGQKVNLNPNPNPKPKPASKCSLCGQAHHLAFCNQFLGMSVEDRLKTVKRLSLCENCLRGNHNVADCRFTNCKVCNQKHNTSLHSENVSAVPQSETKSVAVVSANQKATCLPTAIAYLLLGWRKIPVRLLLDNCAEMSLISEDLVRKYRIPTHNSNAVISGATPGDYTSRHAANVRLKAVNSDFSMEVQAVVHPMLSYHVNTNLLEKPKIKREVPDLDFGEPIEIDHDTIDVIIGADFLHQCALSEKKMIGSLILESTRFGWTTSGVVNYEASCIRASCYFIGDVTDSMRKYFEIEDVDGPQPSETDEIESQFSRSVRYTESGKISVNYPFKRSKSDVADTERMALAALIRNERQLSPDHRALYTSFMQDYLELDHMELIPEEEIDARPRYYLPHHAVIRPSSLTTKLRAVFNGSAKNSSGCSLNDALRVGPVIQPDLFSSLIRFRRHAVAVTADVSKMYRCIEIHGEDRDMQRILWRFNPSEPVRHYRLKTVTYGTSAAPFLATRCLQKVADDNSEQFPEAANSIRTEFYMDDWLSGGSSIEEASRKRKDVHELLANAHLPLVKYMSNSKALLATIENKLHSSLKAVEFNSSDIISILGLKWLPEEDTLAVKSNLNFAETSKIPLTRRTTLSTISKIFDPLGILAPVTITGKILMQDIWREEIDWDEHISGPTREKVNTYLDSLSALTTFRLSRRYPDYEDCTKRQLVGFSDASQHAYSAVLYLRLTKPNGDVSSSLICSKTRVAPIKALTIPRLELCGAVLLAKLALRVRKIFEIEPADVFCFCDSTIALAWIRGPADKYAVFIRNRSLLIQSILPSNHWYHTRGDTNPADLCTRGVTAEKFLQLTSFWSHGPGWLAAGFEEFLQGEIPVPKSVPELRKSAVVGAVTVEPSYFDRFSSFRRLVRVTAWMLRFSNRASGKLRPTTNALSTDEIDKANILVISMAQRMDFSRECAALQQRRALPARSPLNSLNVFVHSDGMLRVGGRLENAALSFERKHPIVLRKSEFAVLLVRDLHLQYFHCNFSLLLSLVRSKYWIIGGVNKLVKAVIRQCVTCTRFSSDFRKQIMANLPAARVQVSRPFAHSGVDFAGPFRVKCTNHRTTKFYKAYLAFFVCFAIKAVHIECVSDATMEAFLMAFERFSARRGTPSHMYSDNAANFVGFSNRVQEDLTEFAAQRRFSWTFIPARSPHCGGLWEAAIKSAKSLITKAIGQQVLSTEQLETVAAKVEAVLNSRPLCRGNSEAAYLTPSHFLIGTAVDDVPAAETFTSSLPKRFGITRQIVQSFWAAWKKDYLHELQTRNKWQKPEANLKVDDLVILRDDAPVLQWPMGRVTSTSTGKDGAVRAVEVLAKGRLLTRSIRTLIKLPVM